MTKAQGIGSHRIFLVNGTPTVFVATNTTKTKSEAVRLGKMACNSKNYRHISAEGMHYRVVELKGGGYRLYLGHEKDTKVGQRKIIGHNVPRNYVPKHRWARGS